MYNSQGEGETGLSRVLRVGAMRKSGYLELGVQR